MGEAEEKAALHALKNQLIEMLGERLTKLSVFGSRARGDFDLDSDIAIVVRDLDRPLKERILHVVAEIELEHLSPMSTLVVDEGRYRHLLKRERRIALDIEREGVLS